MTMTTTRKGRAPKPSSDTVTVTVVEPHLVYFADEQRGGTLDDVPTETAEHWAKHGWVTVTVTPTVDQTTTDDTE
jgi:hypothetical protein